MLLVLSRAENRPEARKAVAQKLPRPHLHFADLKHEVRLRVALLAAVKVDLDLQRPGEGDDVRVALPVLAGLPLCQPEAAVRLDGRLVLLRNGSDVAAVNVKLGP